MELLTYTFVQYAFLGGISIALLAGLLGPFVVHSRQAYASDMFAHVALAGIGAALLLDMGPWWGALPALLLVSTLLWYLGLQNNYSPDSLAILFLSGGLALALAFVHLAEDRNFSFENYLFGSILTLTPAELWGIATAVCLLSAVVYALWYPLIGATQSPAYAIPYSWRPKTVRLLFFWILAVVVWVGIKTVGGLLIGALLVIPTLIVRNWVSSFKALVAGSVLVTVGSMIGGLLLSLFLDLPPSSLIIGVLIVVFVGQLLYGYVVKR